MSKAGRPQKAMVLAAGLGTRMRPLTLTTPKPLVNVAGEALLTHVLHPLFGAVLSRIVINAHHLADQMQAYVKALANPCVVLSDESDQLLDSGGGIKKALPLLGPDPFYVLNADSFWIDGSEPNMQRLADYWDPARMDILLLLATRDQSTGYDGAGDFTMSPEGYLHFRGDEPRAPYIYAGCGILKPSLFEHTPDGPFSLSRLFRHAASQNRLCGLVLDGAWMHVGTVAAITETEQRLKTLNASARMMNEKGHSW